MHYTPPDNFEGGGVYSILQWNFFKETNILNQTLLKKILIGLLCMGFAWNNFGVLVKSSEDEKYLYIFNENSDLRRISKERYRSSIQTIKKKIEILEGKPILFRTSQNTAKWPTSQWFSDIELDRNSFTKNENTKPFSQSTFYDGEEPPVGASDSTLKELEKAEEEKAQLKAERDQAREERDLEKAARESENIAHSEEKEEWKTERSTLIEKNSALELKLSMIDNQIREEKETLSEDDQKEIDQEAKILEKMNIVGTTQHVKIHKTNAYPSHPRRELALRLGIILPDGAMNIELKILNQRETNNYLVELVNFDNTKAVVSLATNEYKNIYVKSFRNLIGKWRENFKRIMNSDEATYKNRADLTLEEFVDIHKKVINRTS